MMKNRLLSHTDITTIYNEKLHQEAKIWADLKEQLFQKYLGQGYWPDFAEVKANHEVNALRSKPKNVHTLHIPPEQTTQGDLD